MKRIILKIKRGWLLFQIHDLERQHDDLCEAIGATRHNAPLQIRLIAIRSEIKADLVRARARYIAMLPPGQRMTFRSA